MAYFNVDTHVVRKTLLHLKYENILSLYSLIVYVNTDKLCKFGTLFEEKI